MALDKVIVATCSPSCEGGFHSDTEKAIVYTCEQVALPAALDKGLVWKGVLSVHQCAACN